MLHIVRPRSKKLPILISCPHSGTEIPVELARAMDPALVIKVPDTDWFVHELYDFGPDLGITLVHARFSRYVIDLNRDPAGQALYGDGRSETSLVPVRSFTGHSLYRGKAPDQAEVARRTEVYFRPYHDAVASELQQLRREFPHVLFYDAHSIQRQVSTIRPEPFPDMILGDQKGKTAAKELTASALATLGKFGRSVAHNDPFMGGYLTRSIGKPATGIHALQLEMSQDIYMNEKGAARDAVKMKAVATLLKVTLVELAATLGRLT